MSKYVQSTDGLDDDLTSSDRRDGLRHDATRLGRISARLIGGSEVTLVNFSNRGLLFESDSRLLIGARASVRLTTTDANLVVTGRVVRSRVKGVVKGALRYDAALALDSELSLSLPDEPEVVATPAPDAPIEAEAPAPLDATAEAPPALDPAPVEPEPHVAFDVAGDLPPLAAADWPAADAPAPDADPAGNDDAVVQLYATVPHDLAELRRLANDNQW